MSSSPIIRCEQVERKFSLDKNSGSELHVLKGISLEIHEGEFSAIVGASGSGKSTLLHILGGLDKPSAGSVYWGEQNIRSLNDVDIAKQRPKFIGFVFQFHHLLPEFSALENVMIACMIGGKSMEESRVKAEALLGKVNMKSRLHHKPSELSGGEQQRTAVARAMANDPKVIFADEPTGNLDSANSDQLLELFEELNSKEKQTFIIVTHNDRFAVNAKRTLRMVDGRLE
ncbi:MAG TPA: ABC transporter ATP-binding protein [Bacteroidota bacterium]|nr:ABC transporter ATP-binding protein [Bacteroidota bacterium]